MSTTLFPFAPWLGLAGNLWSSALPASAPQPALDQPILPGWTFGNLVNITEKNSSAPDTERAIVAEASYGRQLGCIIDVLCDLIERKSPSVETMRHADMLLALQSRIEDIKAGTAEQRLDTFRKAFAAIKLRDPDELHRVNEALQDILAAS